MNNNFESLKRYSRCFEELFSKNESEVLFEKRFFKFSEVIDEINFNFKKLNQDLRVQKKRLDEIFKRTKQKDLRSFFRNLL